MEQGKRPSNISSRETNNRRWASFKDQKKTRIENHNTLLDDIRPRTSSLPARNQYTVSGLTPDYSNTNFIYRVRSFERNSKGNIINRGDWIRSTGSVVSSGSSITEEPEFARHSSFSSSADYVSSGVTSPCSDVTQLKIAIVGCSDVGKTSIAQQFTTSESLSPTNTSFDDTSEKIVSLQLDGEEAQINFVEVDDGKIDIGHYDAYILVYSVTSRCSFDFTVDCLYSLRQEEGNDCAIILVGNKADLVRPKIVTTEEARSVAMTYKCKFVETSALLNMNVDELLVGVVSQIRLKYHVDSKEPKCYGNKTPRVILTKLLCKNNSKSCEDMAVL